MLTRWDIEVESVEQSFWRLKSEGRANAEVKFKVIKSIGKPSATFCGQRYWLFPLDAENADLAKLFVGDKLLK